MKIIGSLIGGSVGHGAGSVATQGLMGAAGMTPPWETHKRADWADSAVSNFLPTPTGSPMPTVGSPQWARGDSMTSQSAMPWAIPASFGTAAAGLYGGNKLVRWLLKKKHKAQLDSELAATKKEYEDAMLGQYDPDKLHKLSAETPQATP